MTIKEEKLGEEMETKRSEGQRQLEIIKRIRSRGKKLNKEAVTELYKIGERNEEHWRNE